MGDEQPITQEDLFGAIRVVADTLAEHQINYAVIGGMAAGYRSQPRFTKDVDFLLQVSQVQLPSLLEALAKQEFQFDVTEKIQEWTRQHMTSLSYHGIPVDWLKPVLPVFQHVLQCATDERWLNHSIRVASAEGLILLKLLAFRTQDLLDIENLIAAQAGSLDVDWIRKEWQTVATLDDPRWLRFMELLRKS